jgi:hypothetical protein
MIGQEAPAMSAYLKISHALRMSQSAKGAHSQSATALGPYGLSQRLRR